MPKLPRLSGKELIKILKKYGFNEVSQSGSHIKLQHPDVRIAIVPNHKELKSGTLKKGILNPNKITVQELISKL